METSIWALWGDTLENSMGNLAQTIALIPYFPGKPPWKFPQRWSSPPRKIASFLKGGLDGISHLKLRASGWITTRPWGDYLQGSTTNQKPQGQVQAIPAEFWAQVDWILNDKDKESANHQPAMTGCSPIWYLDSNSSQRTRLDSGQFYQN